jgi:hypothetical protein
VGSSVGCFSWCQRIPIPNVLGSGKTANLSIKTHNTISNRPIETSDLSKELNKSDSDIAPDFVGAFTETLEEYK